MSATSARKKIALIGCGNLGKIIAEGIINDLREDYVLAGVSARRRESAADICALEPGCVFCEDIGQVMALRPDIVVEAATGAVLKQITLPVLEGGADLIVLSAGAFADEAFFALASRRARELGRRIHIASGAIGGFDVMQSAMACGSVSARILNIKNPAALPENDRINPRERTVLFSGNAVEAIDRFPKNVNVAVALSLATVGPRNTQVEVISDPSLKRNTHRIELEGDFGTAVIEVASTPTKHNPASSQLAAYSVLAKLANLASPVSFIG